jgi:hypothetical protein
MNLHDVYGLVGVSEDNTHESVVAFRLQGPNGQELVYELLTAEPKKVEGLVQTGESMSKDFKQKFRLVRYERVEVIQEFEIPLIETPDEPKLIIP